MTKISMKKILGIGLSAVLMSSMLIGCGNQKSDEITFVSREDGSGTRGAFEELFKLEKKNEDGTKTNLTSAYTEVTSSTSVMMSTISGNVNAIGYTSLGTLNNTVKALKINGVDATVENIKNGTYTISRPFNIVTKGDVSEVAQDFINFILSEEGQKIVEDNGYISEGNTGAFTSTMASGTVKIEGSSSVSPIMAKLQEAYMKVNTNATLELQERDSTSGITSTIEGICDIGMASRELKDSEIEKGVKSTVIAIDGIAVIVNNNNSVDSLTIDQVSSIYKGEVKNWSELG